jgi:type II secretory pathway pseudopilin PulG
VRKGHGFQLVEVIVASAIFFLIALFVLNLLPTSQLAVARAETKMNAETLAYSTLEELRGGAFTNLAPGTVTLPPQTVDNVEFVIHYEVAIIEDSDPDLVKSVSVVTTWTESGEEKSVKAYSHVTAVKRL